MKPHKRSIKDFFSPVSRSPQDSPRGTPQPQDAAITPPSPLGAPFTFTPRNPAPLTINTPVPARHSTSSTPHAPAAKATSPDAQPPAASQTSANSGASKRVVSNGEHVVLNSDSDDDSLPDLDWGAHAATIKQVAPSTRSKRITAYDEADDDDLRKPEKKARNKKGATEHIFESALENMEVEQLIETHKAGLAREEEVTRFVFNEQTLGQAIQNEDDPEQAHRLLLAMQRTNAVQAESVFHFFQDISDTIAVQSKFPVRCLPQHRWTSSFRDASTRDQAFLTGFAQQVFRLQELPEELASWMIDQICLEQSDALDSKYLEILEAHNEHIHTLLNRNKLDAIFRTLGSDVKSVSSDAQLFPSFDVQSTKSPALPPSLKSTARLLGRAAPWLNNKARSRAFYLLCHVCMDDRVVADPDVLGAVQDAIEATLCNFTDSHKLVQGVGSPISKDDVQSLMASQLSDVLPRLLSRVAYPVLQRDLVCALPSSSPMTAYLRRHIALAFVLHPAALDVPLASPQLPTIIHNHLETSLDFRINKETDYSFLAARMTLIDIAVGPGMLTVPYQPLVNPLPSQGDSSPVMAPVPASSELRDFNKEIDALAQHIKMLGNSIVEAGAVLDLRILDAKDSVERLCSRLEHAVRIGGKKSHNVFGSDDEDKQMKVTDIFRKAAANARKTASVKTGGIFDDEDDGADDDAVAAQLASEVAR